VSTITLTSNFSKNTGLVISPGELKRNYLYGITESSPFANKLNLSFSDEDIEFYIRAAQKEIENYLAIKLFRQVFWEKLQFNNDDWRTWGFIKTNMMVVQPLKLEGFLNTTKMAVYPLDWLSAKAESTDELYDRSVWLVPAGNTGAVTNAVIFAGLLPNLGYLNAGRIPNYWTFTYVTGFNKIPYDVLQSVGQLASISLLLIAGSNVLGFPGLQSQSIAIDGLSQSISSSAMNAYGTRIKAVADQLENRMKNQRDIYRGFSFAVC
jgi:hypothetical protein